MTCSLDITRCPHCASGRCVTIGCQAPLRSSRIGNSSGSGSNASDSSQGPPLPRTTVNAEDCSGQSNATEARRARGSAAKANSGPGARLRVKLHRRPETYPATPQTADTAATTAPDTLANPTNASYRRRLSLVQTIPLFASPPR